ncbi:glycosyltransferase family 2 protein [Hymenobacter sp. HD11105]
MTVLEFLCWAALAVLAYTYLGYAVLAGLWARALGPRAALPGFEPDVTLVVPAYNEAIILAAKIANCQALDYPADKLRLLFITDGSTDHSAQILARYPGIWHLHSPVRAGKSVAENRAMEHVTTPYVVFTDCNTNLNPSAIRELVKHYQDPMVGGVSGEKKINPLASASGAGEGLYWRYESFLKRCDSRIYSLMGAAGELVSFRTDLVQPLEADTVLDDFVQSLRIVQRGYRVEYEPRAYATEDPSTSLAEEWKRKVRICAGGWQSMVRLRALLVPRRPLVTFLYVSHRVLRWSLAPLALALLLPLCAVLAAQQGGIYALLLAGQGLFYAAAGLGWQAARAGRSPKGLVVALYFCMMNAAAFAGFWRFLRKAQPAAWEKATRQPVGVPALPKTAL